MALHVIAGGDSRRRNTPWSYIMNVCTHSYSLVWYGWSDWEEFIDWMSLRCVHAVHTSQCGYACIVLCLCAGFGLLTCEITMLMYSVKLKYCCIMLMYNV